MKGKEGMAANNNKETERQENDSVFYSVVTAKSDDRLSAAGMHSVEDRDEATDAPALSDVTVDEVVRLSSAPALHQDGAHRARVQRDHLTVFAANCAELGGAVPVADGHEVAAGHDVDEPARVLKQLGDDRGDGGDATLLAEGLADGGEELERLRGVDGEVAAVGHDGAAAPLAGDEEAAAAQDARYLREKGAVVANLRSTSVSARLERCRMEGHTARLIMRAWTKSMLAESKRKDSLMSCISNWTLGGG